MPAGSVFKFGDTLRRVDRVPLAIITLSLIIRVYFALTYFLNPDEGFSFLFAHQPTLRDVRLETVETIHTYPPLFAFLIHFVLYLGNSEFLLRLPTIVFETVFLAIGYLWMKRHLGYTASLAALLILAFSPGMVSLGYEIRTYGLLLACLVVTLYALDRTFDEQSAKWLAVAMASLYVAILTNYSAAWLCVVFGIYTLVRVLARHLSLRLVGQWIGYQTGAVVIFAWLYQTHISALRGSASEAALHSFLKESYYRPDSDRILPFVWRQSVAAFEYLYELRPVAIVALLLFMAGVFWLLTGKDKEIPHSRLTGFLLALPPVLGCLLAIAGLNPFGNSRHSSIYQPFTAAATGYTIALLARRRWLPVVVASGILIPPWIFTAYRSAWYLPSQDDTRKNMQAAIAFIHTLPLGSTVFADHASMIQLGYYLGRDTYSPYHGRVNPIVDFQYDGYRVLCPGALWRLPFPHFVEGLKQAIAASGVPLSSIWVFDAGSGGISDELQSAAPRIQASNVHRFGSKLTIFQVQLPN